MDSTYSRILFANIGWMISYKGQSSEDLISGGGSYSDADKHEAFNFQNLNGYCYGYFQPTGDNVNLSRIDVLPLPMSVLEGYYNWFHS